MGRWRAVGRVLGAGLLPGLLAACYTYRPLPAAPEPQTRVAFVLTDYGRVGAAPQIGAQAMRVEGDVLATSDSGYLLAVSGVKPIRGSWVRWTGEQVNVRPDYVAQMYVRRFSRGRTALMLGGAAFTALTLMVNLNIFGFGGLDIPLIPGAGGDPGDQ